MPNKQNIIRTITSEDFPQVANLIQTSTNTWYLKNRGFEIFPGESSDCLLFPEVYDDLDPGECLIATQPDGTIVGSCFLHPRETHIAIGIVNSAPDSSGAGVASQLMDAALHRAATENKPLRLVSSAMNLDSFSLYSRKGFIPIEFYQDMMIPEDKALPDSPLTDQSNITPARPKDASEIAELEFKISAIRRESDWRYFAENTRGIWHLLIHRDPTTQKITGALNSIKAPASHIIGSGFAQTTDVATSLLEAQLRHHHTTRPLFLLPSRFPELTAFAYSLGARNTELHVLQSTASSPPSPTAITFPSFMPETG